MLPAPVQFLGHFGLVTFYQHTPSRAVHLGISRDLASLLPLVSGVATGVSRVLLSFVANAPYTDRLLQFAVALSAAAAVQCTTFLARDFATLALYGALQGVLIGESRAENLPIHRGGGCKSKKYLEVKVLKVVVVGFKSIFPSK